jgi:hypothetical protein
MAAEVEENKLELLGEELEQNIHNDVVIILQNKQHDISLKWAIEQQKRDQQSFDGLIHFLPNLCEELSGLIQEYQHDQAMDDQNLVDEQEHFVEIEDNFHFQNDFQNDIPVVEEPILQLGQDEIDDQDQMDDQDEMDDQDQMDDENDQLDEVNPLFIEQEQEEEEQVDFKQILVFIQEIWRMLLVQQCVMLPIQHRAEIIYLLRLPVINKKLILSRLNFMIEEQDFQEPILIERLKTLHYSQEYLQKTADLIDKFFGM